MKQFLVLFDRGTDGEAMLVGTRRRKPNGFRALPPVVALLIGCGCASTSLSAALQPHGAAAGAGPIAAAGRQGGQPNCPSLVDGRGATVRSRGTGGTAESSFAKDCPTEILQPHPIAAEALAPPAPLKPAKIPESSTGVRGLAAGTVQPDPDLADDFPDGAPLVVRVTPERLSATVLTGGTTLWLLHSGFWTYLLILGLPLWRHVDLLPIVDPTARGSERASKLASAAELAGAEEERAVPRVLRGLGRARGARHGKS